MALVKTKSTEKTLSPSSYDGIIQALKQLSNYPDRYTRFEGYAKDGQALKKQEPYRLYRYYSGAAVDNIAIPEGYHLCITSVDLLLLGAAGTTCTLFDQGFGTDAFLIDYWVTAGEVKHWYFKPPRTIPSQLTISASAAGVYVWINGFLEQN